jgi:hypothetical protein
MCCFDAIDNSRTHYTRSCLLCYKTDLLLLFASMPSISDVCGQFLIVIQSISLRFSCLHTASASPISLLSSWITSRVRARSRSVAPTAGSGLAIIGKSRSPLFPDIPTIDEARDDYPATWFGHFAPAGTPRPIVVKLAAEVPRIRNEPGFRKRMFVDRAVEPTNMKLKEFSRFIRNNRKIAERILSKMAREPQPSINLADSAASILSKKAREPQPSVNLAATPVSMLVAIMRGG